MCQLKEDSLTFSGSFDHHFHQSSSHSTDRSKMPRKSRLAVRAAESDGDGDIKQEVTVKDEKDDIKVEITVKDEKDDIKVEITLKDENDDTSLLSVVTIPFLTDRVQSEEEIPTYVVEKSKSARAIWWVILTFDEFYHNCRLKS